MTRALISIALLLLWEDSSEATTPSDLCTGNPCVISKVAVLEDTVLDFGAGTEVRLTRGATLQVGVPGAATAGIELKAGSFVLEAGSRILARTTPRTGWERSSVLLDAQGGSIDVRRGARVDLRGGSGSALELRATGDVLLRGKTDLRAKGDYVEAAALTVRAGGNAVLGGKLDAYGRGFNAFGSVIDVRAVGAVTVEEPIRADAQFGGEIFLSSETASVNVEKTLDVRGRLANDRESGGGEGGYVTIETLAGDVNVAGSLIAMGATAGSAEYVGVGGAIEIVSSGSIRLDGSVQLAGGANADAGTFTAVAEGDFVQGSRSALSSAATPAGPDGIGGPIWIETLGDAVLGRILFDGPEAGTLEVTSAGDIRVLGPIVGTSSLGFGGVVALSSEGGVVIEGSIDVRAPGEDGVGGFVDVAAVTVDVLPTAKLDSRSGLPFPGFSGHRLRASGAMTIAGMLLAGGSNELVYETVPPVVTGLVDPAPTLVFDPPGP